MVFIGLMIKNVHLPFFNSTVLIFNAFTVWSLCPDNKHNKITNFSDRSFKGKWYSKLLRQSRKTSGPYTTNCLGGAGLKLNMPLIKRWTRGYLPKDIPLFIMKTDDRIILQTVDRHYISDSFPTITPSCPNPTNQTSLHIHTGSSSDNSG